MSIQLKNNSFVTGRLTVGGSTASSYQLGVDGSIATTSTIAWGMSNLGNSPGFSMGVDATSGYLEIDEVTSGGTLKIDTDNTRIGSGQVYLEGGLTSATPSQYLGRVTGGGSGVMVGRTAAEVLSDIGAASTSGFTSGEVPFATSSVNLAGTSNFVYSDTNKQLNVRGKATALADQPCIPMLIDNSGGVDGRVMLQIKTNDVSTASAQGAGITLTAPQNTTGTYDPVNSLILLQTKQPGNQTIHSAPKNIKFYVDNDGTGAGAGKNYNAFGDLAFELLDS